VVAVVLELDGLGNKTP
jgi:hypothetical protein